MPQGTDVHAALGERAAGRRAGGLRHAIVIRRTYRTRAAVLSVVLNVYGMRASCVSRC